jgi:uncharacterized protein CbrC (UPF0167 family)
MKTKFEAFVEEILCHDYSPEGIDEWGDLNEEHQEEIKIEVIDDDVEYKSWEEYFFDCNERLDLLKGISRSHINGLLDAKNKNKFEKKYANNAKELCSKVKKEFCEILDDYCKWRVDEIIANYTFPTERELYFSDNETELLEEMRGD